MCVCTEPNDQSRYAGVRESLKSSEYWRALLDAFFIQQRRVGGRRALRQSGSFHAPDCRRFSLNPPQRDNTRRGQTMRGRAVAADVTSRVVPAGHPKQRIGGPVRRTLACLVTASAPSARPYAMRGRYAGQPLRVRSSHRGIPRLSR
jgi:hypothetical protein